MKKFDDLCFSIACFAITVIACAFAILMAFAVVGVIIKVVSQ